MVFYGDFLGVLSAITETGNVEWNAPDHVICHETGHVTWRGTGIVTGNAGKEDTENETETGIETETENVIETERGTETENAEMSIGHPEGKLSDYAP